VCRSEKGSVEFMHFVSIAFASNCVNDFDPFISVAVKWLSLVYL